MGLKNYMALMCVPGVSVNRACRKLEGSRGL